MTMQVFAPICRPCAYGYRIHGDCVDPLGRERRCFCFAENENHRYVWSFPDDGMAADAQKDRGDGGLGSGGYIQRWEDEKVQHAEATKERS